MPSRQLTSQALGSKTSAGGVASAVLIARYKWAFWCNVVVESGCSGCAIVQASALQHAQPHSARTRPIRLVFPQTHVCVAVTCSLAATTLPFTVCCNSSCTADTPGETHVSAGNASTLSAVLHGLGVIVCTCRATEEFALTTT
jgi:hypothetical protein